ncbi:kinase-like domain-containing protein [Thamnocephalis sphaerospora]|uniref:Kinase-like domain-containing protein n=1 Tax=Thamnocephalis sphaerospora TaxID=78915 RepID=A0A4P9XH20_9FUNG|nr:kinase-like domain-containing protein [Thamnocephalis sphaerospora]|eukprot:RKP04480.1 kinase-like domain-containing protein [Thamnocephalis sphaerospora]
MGHTAVSQGERILIWGGLGAEDDTRIYALDTDTWSWSYAGPDSVLPPPGNGDDASDDTNGTVVTVIAIVCSLVGLLAIVVLAIIGMRKRRAQRKEKECAEPAAIVGMRVDSTTSRGSFPVGSEARESVVSARSQGTQQSSVTTPLTGGMACAGATSATSTASLHEEHRTRQPEGSLAAAALHARRAHRRRAATTRTGDAEQEDDDDLDRWTFASSISFGQRTAVPTIAAASAVTNGSATSLGRSGQSATDPRAVRYLPPAGVLPRSRSVSQAMLQASAPSMVSVASGGTPSAQSTPLAHSTSPPSSPHMSAMLTSGGSIAGMISPLDQIARLRLNQMRRVDGALDAAAAGGADDAASDSSSRKSGDGPKEMVQVRSGDARESVEGFLMGSIGGRSVMGASPLPEPDIATDGEPGPVRRRHTIRIGNDVLERGTVLFNRYIIDDHPLPLVGDKTMVVFAADDTAGELVAIKLFELRGAWEREYIALRFLRGPQVAALRNIYNLADERTGSERYVIVTERYGHRLHDVLQADPANMADASIAAGDAPEPLDAEARAPVARSVANCLAVCHAHGIIVGDFSPKSLAQQSDGEAQYKLVALEHANQAGLPFCVSTTKLTRYSAPEVVEAVRAQTELLYAATIDLWALGCILYEILAGKPLFDASIDDEELLTFIVTASPGCKLGGVMWTEDGVLMADDLPLRVPDESAQLAIASLLSRDPNCRLAAIEVLKSI